MAAGRLVSLAAAAAALGREPWRGLFAPWNATVEFTFDRPVTRQIEVGACSFELPASPSATPLDRCRVRLPPGETALLHLDAAPTDTPVLRFDDQCAVRVTTDRDALWLECGAHFSAIALPHNRWVRLNWTLGGPDGTDLLVAGAQVPSPYRAAGGAPGGWPREVYAGEAPGVLLGGPVGHPQCGARRPAPPGYDGPLVSDQGVRLSATAVGPARRVEIPVNLLARNLCYGKVTAV